MQVHITHSARPPVIIGCLASVPVGISGCLLLRIELWMAGQRQQCGDRFCSHRGPDHTDSWVDEKTDRFKAVS